MKALSLLLLIPSLALAQAATPANKVRTLDAITQIKTDSVRSHSNATMLLQSDDPNTTGPAFKFKATNDFGSSPTANSFVEFYHSTSLVLQLWNSGRIDLRGPANNSAPGFRFYTPSGGDMVFRITGGSGEHAQLFANNSTVQDLALGAGGLNPFHVYLGPNATTGTPEVDINNSNITSTLKMVFSATDSSGSPGAATINKPSFQVAIASAATSVTVTNSLVSTSSIVLCALQTNDGTKYITSVAPGSGSVVISLSAAAGGNDKVGCTVFN